MDKAYNVASVSKNATGRYRINFAVPFADTNYLVTGGGQFGPYGDNNYVDVGIDRQGTKATSYCDIVMTEHPNLTAADASAVILFQQFSGAHGTGGGGGGGGAPWYFSPPTAASMLTLTGDGNPLTLADDADVGLLIDCGVPAGGDVLRMAYRPLTDKTQDWTLTTKIDFSFWDANYVETGVMLYDTLSGRLISFGYNNTNIYRIAQWQWGVNGGFVGNIWYTGIRGSQMSWLRARHASGVLYFDISHDGKQWYSITSIADASFTANNVDMVGIGAKLSAPGVPSPKISVPYFSLTGPAV